MNLKTDRNTDCRQLMTDLASQSQIRPEAEKRTHAKAGMKPHQIAERLSRDQPSDPAQPVKRPLVVMVKIPTQMSAVHPAHLPRDEQRTELPFDVELVIDIRDKTLMGELLREGPHH